MHAFHSSAAGVIHVLEGSIPFESDSCGAGDRGLLVNASGCGVAREVFGKDAAVVILLLVERRIDRETLGCVCHLFVGHGFGGYLLQGVTPRITYALAELLLLSPSNLLR